MLSLTLFGILVLLLLLLYKYIIHPSFISPLSKVPNAHLTSPFIPLQLWSKQRLVPNTRAVFAAHQKHGPVLRLGPNELSCVTPSALRTIYTGGFDKETLYEDFFQNFGIPPMVAKLTSKPHSVQKRMISNVYSKSCLQTSPDLQKLSHHLIYSRFLPIMQSAADKGSGVDVFDFGQAVAMDFISAYLFGLSNSTDFMRNVEFRHHWYEAFASAKILLPHEREGGEIEKWCLDLCKATERSLLLHPQETDSELYTSPVVYSSLSQGLSQTASQKPDPQHVSLAIASEMLDHIVAGHETTAITLTYLMHEISKQPALQARLREELLTLDPPVSFPPSSDQPSNLPTPRSLDALPLLDGIIFETLRLYAAAPARQPRVTPYVPGGTTIDGYPHIPGGVVVSSNAYTLHRNPEVFPEPEQWVPERWLDERPGKREEMKRWFWAFGSGGRMCIGRHFSVQEMKLVVAAVYSNYESERVGADDGGMEQVDEYVARPVGEKCVLRFKHV